MVCPENGDWDAASEARLDHFLDAWPSLRPQVLQALCDYYEELHRKNQLFVDPILAPKPGTPEIVEDRLRITSIHLRGDGLIGLSGSCIWEDEHGVGVLLKGSDVIEAGRADVATAPR